MVNIDVSNKEGRKKVLETTRFLWRGFPRTTLFEKSLSTYLDILRNHADTEELIEEVAFMLSCYHEPHLPSDSMAAHIVRLLGVHDLTKVLFHNPLYQRDVSICIMLEASGLMPFDDWEIANVKKVMLHATGYDIANVEEELVATKVAELLFAPGWSELVFSDWTMYTSSAQKVQQLLVAPLRNSCENPQTTLEIPNDIAGGYDA